MFKVVFNLVKFEDLDGELVAVNPFMVIYCNEYVKMGRGLSEIKGVHIKCGNESFHVKGDLDTVIVQLVQAVTVQS
jgi:hypothetical protein